MTADDLIAWEKKYGNIPDGAAILVNSGWSQKYGTLAFTDIIYDEHGNVTGILW